MRITTQEQFIAVTLSDDQIISWEIGTDTAKLFLDGREIDCFTFASDKSKISKLDFYLALGSFLEYRSYL
jgi:hypothetical protein